MSNQELVDKYIESLPLLSKETITPRKYFLGMVAREFEKPFTEISLADLRKYIIQKKESGSWTKATTISQYIILFKIFYKFLINEGYMKEENNPAKNLKTPRQHSEGELRTLNAEEIRRLLKTVELPIINLQQRLVFYLAMTSGLRASEIRSIKRENIDLTKRLIYIPKEDVKGQYREKLVPISNRTKELLEAYTIQNPSADGFLLKNRLGNKFSRMTIYRVMKTVIDYAYPYKNSWKKPSGPHIARHTFASRWIESGGDWHALRAIMGWRSFQQFDRYVNVSPEFITRAAMKIERKLLKP